MAVEDLGIYLFDQRDGIEPLVRQKLNENFRRIQRSISVDQSAALFELDEKVDEIGEVATDDYEDLRNKPKIESVTLQGDKSFPELGIFIDPDEEYPRSDDYALTNADIDRLWNGGL